MTFSLFSFGGGLMLIRWFHFLGGITWIGMLYYLNFAQGAFMAATDGPTKAQVNTKLFPKVMWYFRWGAMLTFLMGWAYLGMAKNFNPSIIIGATLGSLMWFNVWFVIWPIQKKNIASAAAVAGGGQADATVAPRLPRAATASRTNVLFSIPMLFFMGASAHLPIFFNENANRGLCWGVIMGIIALIELNALKGKQGPLTTVKGVIHCGFALAIVLYVLLEILTK